MKIDRDTLTSFLRELGKDVQSGKASPLSRLEVIALEMYTDWLAKRSNESGEPRPQSSFARLDGPPFFEDDQECLYCHRPIGQPHKPGCRQ